MSSEADFLRAIANNADRRQLVEIFGWREVDPTLKALKRAGKIELSGDRVSLTARGKDELERSGR